MGCSEGAWSVSEQDENVDMNPQRNLHFSANEMFLSGMVAAGWLMRQGDWSHQDSPRRA